MSVGALISRVAKENGVSSTTLLNTVTSESQMNPNAVGDHGLAVGLTQIHYKEWGFTKEQVLDPEFSLTFLAKHIKAGDAWKYWTSLNCFTYLLYAQKIPLPSMARIVSNTDIPHIGEVAIFWYTDKETGKYVKHVAVITKLLPGGNFEVLEANFEAGKVGRRVININDSHLQGFLDVNVL